jgi:LuxR family maltose regulon positive regulatory protein
MIALSEYDPNHKYTKDALTLLLRLSDIADKFGWFHHRIQILVLAAKVYHLLNERDNAITTLSEALTLSEPSRYVRIYIGEGSRIGDLLNAILDSQNGSPESQLSKSKEKYVKALLSTPGMDLYESKPADGERLIEPLTDRELDVLRFLVTNKTVPEIADELIISPNTVRSHVKHIYEKLGVHRRLSAVKIAKDLNLV